MKRISLLLVVLLSLLFAISCQSPECETDEQCKGNQRCLSGQCICRPPLIACGGACINTLQDSQHCGRCDNACQSGTRCILGRCLCPQEQTLCDGKCTDIQTNPSHCGQCGQTCPSDKRCVDGACRALCPDATPTVCDGGCFQTQSSDLHCGGCNQACTNGRHCFSGSCQCSPGTELCQGRCMSLSNHNQHCGSCNNPCGQAQVCYRGRCITQCPAATPAVCFGGCANLQDDDHNCGQCGNACPVGTRCIQGQCECPQGLAKCNGKCVDLESDSSHCRRCNQACGKGQRCSQATCTISCPTATPTVCFGGCVELKSDSLHCGACGARCIGGKNCVQGTCVCPKGTTECNGQCIQLQANGLHCGACNKSCPAGEFCSQGSCVKECPKATPTICQGGCMNLATNVQNCGACNKTCAPGMSCENKRCTCPSSQTSCNGRCIDLQSNAIHCGACNNRCPKGLRCNKGLCVRNCGSQVPTLCNDLCVNLKTDRRHCGTCGQSCPAHQQCENGKCGCPKGTTDCSNQCVNLKTDLRHCGACANTCQAGFACTRGQCLRVCPPGQTECSNQCVNLQLNHDNCGACETKCKLFQQCVQGKCKCPPKQTLCGDLCVSTETDTRHCGACGKACASDESCVNGACQRCTTTKNTCGKSCCPTPYTCCNQQCVRLSTSQQHCGTCGTACKAGEFCCQGTCKNFTNDAQHCGGCGIVCKTGETCCYGKCVNLKTDGKSCGACGIHCQSGQTCCNGSCVDTTLDSKNCGSCSTTCKVNEGCCGGSCIVTQLTQGQVYQGVSQKVAQEVCDKKDNDCNGQVDEGACYSLESFQGGSVQIQSMAVDSQGNEYIAGTFKNKMIIQGTTYQHKSAQATDKQLYIVKRSSSGKALWVFLGRSYNSKQTNITSLLEVAGLTVTSSGLVYAVVNFGESLDIGPKTLVSKIETTFTIIQLNPKGQLTRNSIAVSSKQPTGFATIQKITVRNNRLTMIGTCRETIQFGQLQLSCSQSRFTTYTAELDVLLQYTKVKFPSDGLSENLGAYSNNYDSNGNLILGGQFSKSILIKGKRLSSNTLAHFVGKISNQQNLSWLVKLSDGALGNLGMALDPKNAIYLSFNFSKTMYLGTTTITHNQPQGGISSTAIVKLETSGRILWYKLIGQKISNLILLGPFFDQAQNVIYTVMKFQGKLSLGSKIYIGTSSSVVIASFDPNGNFLKAQQLSATRELDIFSVALSQKMIHVTGDFDGIFRYKSTTLTNSTAFPAHFYLKIPKF